MFWRWCGGVLIIILLHVCLHSWLYYWLCFPHYLICCHIIYRLGWQLLLNMMIAVIHVVTEWLPAALLFFVALEVPYSMVRHSASATVTRGSFSAVISWLQQHCAFWFATSAGRQAPVCPECCSTAGICSPLLQPHQPTSCCSLHWLWVADCIIFRLAVLTSRCLHSSAPKYLSTQLQWVSDVHTHQWLRSSSSIALVISRTCRATISIRGFSAAATSVWNSLPEAVHSPTYLALFRNTGWSKKADTHTVSQVSAFLDHPVVN